MARVWLYTTIEVPSEFKIKKLNKEMHLFQIKKIIKVCLTILDETMPFFATKTKPP